MGKEVIIRPNVTGSNLTLIWTITINGTTKVIDKNRKEFFLKDKNMVRMYIYVATYIYIISRLMLVSREAKEEVPCGSLSTNAREYFTRANLGK